MTLAIVNPATGEWVAEVPELAPEDVERMAARAREVQPAWEALGVQRRCALLRRVRGWLLDHAEVVIDTVMAETGKTWEDAELGEVGYTAQALAFWARQAPMWLADERPRSRQIAVKGRRLVVRHPPLGVVGVIAPWNYPLANGFGDAIPALAAGNTVVLKPSEHTPLVAQLLERGLREVGVPEGVLQVVVGRGDTGAQLIDHVDMVMFTGSTATGRKVAERAGRNLIPCSLELGGKDPMIVLADANLERAANSAVYYALQNSGQVCLSVERIYVEASVHDAFVEKVVAKVRALRQGDPSGGPGSVDVGALTFDGQMEIVAEHVDDALGRGARALTGGRPRAGAGRFYEPTVLVDVDHTMRCMREETFGPTIPIMRVRDAEEAIRLANDSPYGLAASVFTRDAARGEAIARRLHAGSVAVNDALVFFVALELPMGGWKDSGVGTRHGVGGIRKYTRPQSLVVARWLPSRDPHFFPNRRARARALLWLLRRTRG